MGKNAEKNAITYVEICKIYDYIQICANLCKNKYSKFWKCHCSKICDMRFFAKYALAYAITCSHITGIPNHSPERGTWLRPKYGALQALQIAAKPLQIVTLATHCGQRYRFPKIRVPPPKQKRTLPDSTVGYPNATSGLVFYKQLWTLNMIDRLSSVLRPRQHSIGYMGLEIRYDTITRS